MTPIIYSFLSFFLLTIGTGDGHPTGAPTAACAAMVPRHNYTAQACPAGYVIESTQSFYDINNVIGVTVRGLTGSNTFKGVLLIAKVQQTDQIVGTWSTSNSLLQTLACGGTANTGITHTSNVDKTRIDVTWNAPAVLPGDGIVLRATIVQSYAVFYVNCFNLTLTVRQGNQSTNAANSTTVGPSLSPTVGPTTTTAPLTSDVGVSVGWTFANGVTTVKMSISNLQASQWAAFALSTDEMMGNDHVFMCRRLADDTISLQRMINPGGHSAPTPVSATDNVGGTLAVTAQRFTNGVVSCEFTLSNFTSSKRLRRQASVFTLTQTGSYQPLVAIGNIDSSNTIRKHTTRSPLSQSVQLNRQETVNYNAAPGEEQNRRLMKAHGILMIFAWMVFVSTGILIAQFFKTAWPERKIFGKAIWFTLHRIVMSSAALLTIIAFILILVYEKGTWIPRSKTREFAHSIVGIIVISFAVIQPIMALFRCAPDGHYRFIFNYVHGVVGYSAFILSIAAIFLATVFTELNFQINNVWGIVVAWICWVAVIYLVFLAVEFYFRTHQTQVEDPNSYDMSEHASARQAPKERTKVRVNVMGDRLKTVLLVIHLLVALGLALFLVILVGQLEN